MSDQPPVRIERHGAVTLVTIDRPKVLNALSLEVRGALIEAFAAYDADPEQKCLVLTGAGEKAFVAGADINEFLGRDSIHFYLNDASEWEKRIGATRKPWIAAVNGLALGGGCELAMMADFIIASERARFGQPEITLGIAPGMGGSQRLTRAVGKAKAMEMCLTGRMMDAVEAERSGLVSRIVPAADLLDDALRTAATIAAMPPVAAMVCKEMVDLAFEAGLAQGIQLERRLFQIAAATQDRVEGMNAFVERRPGIWQGR